MKTEIRILIADDHPIFRQGLRQVIEKAAHLKVVAEAEDGIAALDGIRECQPEIAILDIDMPNQDGFAVARGIREHRLPVTVIFLTMHKDELHFNEAPPNFGMSAAYLCSLWIVTADDPTPHTARIAS